MAEDKEGFSKEDEINWTYEKLDHISKLLKEREVLLIDANLALEDKNRALEDARQELQQTSEFLADLLNYSPDAIWVLNPGKKVIRFNKMAEEITGYQVGELMGQTLAVMFDNEEHYFQLLDTLEEQGNLSNIRTRIRKKDGEPAELLMSISLLRKKGSHGEPVGTVTISKDITREVKLEHALSDAYERLEGTVRKRTQDLEALSQSFIVMNQISTMAGQSQDLRQLLENILELVLELTGFPMGAVCLINEQARMKLEAEKNLPLDTQKNLCLLVDEEGVISRAADSGFLQLATEAKELESLDPTLRLAVAVPLRIKGRICGVMSLLTKSPREVTDEERDMLLALGIQVAGAIENARLYEQVQGDIEKLKEVDRIKSEFIATISHELRTPLTSIIGFLSFALMEFDKADMKKIRRYITISLENAQKLAIMIEDLLALQKLDSGNLRLRVEPVCLKDMLADLSMDLTPQLRSKKQNLVIDLPTPFPALLVDREQFERVLINLITNAIKFSEKPGKIITRARHDQARGEITISVIDSGIGMSPETCEMIFERFYQAENTLTRRAGGAGLGLTIAKRIVEIHHGRLQVKSRLNEGSRFDVIIPDQPVIEDTAQGC